MKKVLGYSILVLLFVAIAAAIWILTGIWWTPLLVYGAVALLVGLTYLAVYLTI
jgi:hypothetical protein